MTADAFSWSTLPAVFAEAKGAIEATFAAQSAPEIVRSVLRGDQPREGVCLNGLEYLVHGVGYTVVLPSEGHVHFDGSAEGDFFTQDDVALFLTTAELCDSPDPSEVAGHLDALCIEGSLIKLRSGRYSLP